MTTTNGPVNAQGWPVAAPGVSVESKGKPAVRFKRPGQPVQTDFSDLLGGSAQGLLNTAFYGDEMPWQGKVFEAIKSLGITRWRMPWPGSSSYKRRGNPWPALEAFADAMGGIDVQLSFHTWDGRVYIRETIERCEAIGCKVVGLEFANENVGAFHSDKYPNPASVPAGVHLLTAGDLAKYRDITFIHTGKPSFLKEDAPLTQRGKARHKEGLDGIAAFPHMAEYAGIATTLKNPEPEVTMSLEELVAMDQLDFYDQEIHDLLQWNRSIGSVSFCEVDVKNGQDHVRDTTAGALLAMERLVAMCRLRDQWGEVVGPMFFHQPISPGATGMIMLDGYGDFQVSAEAAVYSLAAPIIAKGNWIPVRYEAPKGVSFAAFEVGGESFLLFVNKTPEAVKTNLPASEATGMMPKGGTLTEKPSIASIERGAIPAYSCGTIKILAQ